MSFSVKNESSYNLHSVYYHKLHQPILNGFEKFKAKISAILSRTLKSLTPSQETTQIIDPSRNREYLMNLRKNGHNIQVRGLDPVPLPPHSLPPLPKQPRSYTIATQPMTPLSANDDFPVSESRKYLNSLPQKGWLSQMLSDHEAGKFSCKG